MSELRWNSPFIEIEDNASGWFWRLRDRNHRCLAKSPKDYATFEEMKADLELVPAMIAKALTVAPLKSIERRPRLKERE